MALAGVFLWLAFLSAPAMALDVPAAPQGRVNDYAAVFDGGSRGQLEANLRQFEMETSTQIVVAIFPSLEGEDLEDFVNRLFQVWRLGQKGSNNGVLLAIFMADRRARIEVGYGLEGVLTDALSSRIIRNELRPAFRERRYVEGIERTVAAIEQATRGEYRGSGRGGRVVGIPIGTIVLILLLLGLFGGGGGSFWPIFVASQVLGSGGRRSYRDGGWWGGGFGGGLGGGGGFGGGGGGFSGGGGMSGGGGASGSW